MFVSAVTLDLPYQEMSVLYYQMHAQLVNIDLMISAWVHVHLEHSLKMDFVSDSAIQVSITTWWAVMNHALQISILLKHVYLFALLDLLKMATNVYQLDNLVPLINSSMHILVDVNHVEAHVLLVLEQQLSAQIVFKDLI